MTKRLAMTANYARTAMLMAFLLALLAIGGHMIGGMQGMLLFGAIGLVMNFAMYWFSDRIALLAHRAQEVSPAEAPTLHRIVARLANRAGIPQPRVYLIPSDSPNAFATGRNPEHAVVAVTQGLLNLLSERELEGVVAHELSHVRNRDILISTIAAAVAGLVASAGHLIQWSMMFAGRRDDDEGGSLIGVLAWAILAPLVAMLVQLAISRSREYGADATGAALCGDPDALANALERLEDGKRALPYPFAGPATAHLFIVNPLRSGGLAAGLMGLFSTHPPTEERVRRLRAMHG